MMRTTVRTLFVFSALLLSVDVWSQVAFGPKGGLNLTNLNVKDPEASYQTRAGYHAGIFFRGRFDKVAIQPEVLLFTHRNDVSFVGDLGTIEQSFSYLSIPVMFKFYPIGGLNLQAGPQFGFLLDGEQRYNTILFSGTRDIKDAYKNSDVSISAGAGWDFKFGLNIDFRYNIGVKDINDTADGEEARSRVFLVSLGWNFLR